MIRAMSRRRPRGGRQGPVSDEPAARPAGPDPADAARRNRRDRWRPARRGRGGGRRPGDRPEVAIIDNDNVGLDGGDVFVWGTLRFMAPEVVRREAAPSSLTDLHSLAVFLFYLFMHGHPLEGVKTDESYSWADSSHRSETDLALRHFGTEPVFIFDPDDHSNPPRPGDPVSVWWRLYPRFFPAVFERAFTSGLRDPSGLGRVAEGVWRPALVPPPASPSPRPAPALAL